MRKERPLISARVRGIEKANTVVLGAAATRAHVVNPVRTDIAEVSLTQNPKPALHLDFLPPLILPSLRLVDILEKEEVPLCTGGTGGVRGVRRGGWSAVLCLRWQWHHGPRP